MKEWPKQGVEKSKGRWFYEIQKGGGDKYGTNT